MSERFEVSIRSHEPSVESTTGVIVAKGGNLPSPSCALQDATASKGWLFPLQSVNVQLFTQKTGTVWVCVPFASSTAISPTYSYEARRRGRLICHPGDF